MPADTVRVSDLSAEARFVSVDPETGIETFVFVATSFRTVLDSPQPGGPDLQPDTIIQVIQEAPDIGLIFSGSYGGSEIVPVFTTHGRDVISAHIEGTIRLEIATPDTIAAMATFDFTFQAAGPTVHEVVTDTGVIPGGFVGSGHINSFHRDATATGTLTIEDILNPLPPQLSTTEAELQQNNSGSVTLLPGAALGDGAGTLDLVPDSRIGLDEVLDGSGALELGDGSASTTGEYDTVIGQWGTPPPAEGANGGTDRVSLAGVGVDPANLDSLITDASAAGA
jgi:hypothetical protein